MLPLAPAATFGGFLPSCLGASVLVGLTEGYADRWALKDGGIIEISTSRAMGALPVVAAGKAAREVSTMGDMAMTAGIVSGCLCTEHTIAALVSGTYAEKGYLCSKLTAACLTWGVPATSISFYATVPAGFTCGIAVNALLPLIRILWALLASADVLLSNMASVWAKAVIGAAMGCLMCFGSKVGWYHRIFLPVIVLELAAGRGSIWGAIYLCAVCMVAAGLCAAHVIRPSSKHDVPFARRAIRINVCSGDFMEACYPFMDRCDWCNLGGYVGSALSGALIAIFRVFPSAYIPLLVAVVICDEPVGLTLAVSAAFFPAFLFGLK